MPRYFGTCIGLVLLLGAGGIASAQVGFQFTVPGVSIGVDVPTYPRLVPVPGYPVYYAPELENNFFFYDGLYWLYADDRWYASEWYDGPWQLVEPESVPYFVLRVPVRYYRRPPPYFREWDRGQPPRWGEHWGRDWEQRHHEWDRWNRGSRPPRAPLPEYQRNYPRERYPSPEHQQSLRDRDYHHQPREAEDRRMLGHPSVPRHDLDSHSQENRPHAGPGNEGRGHFEQSNPGNQTGPREPHNSIPPSDRARDEQHRRAPAPPERREATGVPGTPPRPATPPARSPNMPQPRDEGAPARPLETPGAQRPPQEQRRPPQINPGARPQSPQQPSARPQPPQQPSARPQSPQPPSARPQPPQQPNRSRRDVQPSRA